MKKVNLILFTALLLFVTSCGEKKVLQGWRYSDDLYVAIDETFRPIMDEELDAFSMHYIDAGLHPTYCSEDSAIRMMLRDSVRSCVITRQLSDKEKAIIQSHNLGLQWAQIATDALALITNKENPDSLITVDEIKGIVSGKDYSLGTAQEF